MDGGTHQVVQNQSVPVDQIDDGGMELELPHHVLPNDHCLELEGGERCEVQGYDDHVCFFFRPGSKVSTLSVHLLLEIGMSGMVRLITWLRKSCHSCIYPNLATVRNFTFSKVHSCLSFLIWFISYFNWTFVIFMEHVLWSIKAIDVKLVAEITTCNYPNKFLFLKFLLY